MNGTTLPVASTNKVSPDDAVDHIYCCDVNESLCGLDISDLQEVSVLPNLCVVCDDLYGRSCERCGE